MRVLATHLWKEWRDHRVGILGFLFAAPVMLALAYRTMAGGWWATTRDVPAIATIVGFLIAAAIFGADLVPGEVRRGRLEFLARLPGDLLQAFLSKLLFFLLMLGVFAAWSWWVATIVGFLFGNGWWFLPKWWGEFGTLGWASLVGASWIFAVSCWLPRGAFTLPATALTLSVGLGPAFAAFALNPEMKLHDGGIPCASTWLAGAGVLVGAVSFVRGLRHGGTMASRIGWSLGPTLLAFAPVWIWATMRVREFRHLDPNESTFQLYACAMGRNGRFAFVMGSHTLAPAARPGARAEYGDLHPIVVDVATGDWREAGPLGGMFVHLGHRWESASATSILLVDGPRNGEVPVTQQFTAGFDGRTGELLSNEQWKPLLLSTSGFDWFRKWETYTAALPDGRLAWGVETNVVVRESDGTLRMLPTEGRTRWVLPLGLGFGGDSGIGFGAIYDCTRQRTWRTKDIDDGDENADVDVRLVRATSWVVRRKVGSEFRTELWNPDDGRFAPIAGWNAGKTIALHPDGRVMVLETSAFDRLGRIRQDSPPGKLLLLDPERGVREELALPDALKSRLIDGWSYGFTIDGDLLLTLRCLLPDRAGYGTEWIARFDPRTDQLVCIGPFGMLYPDVLGCPDRESVVFVAEQRRLMRAHFDGRPTETLFPR